MSIEAMKQALDAFEAIMFEKDAESCQLIAKNARYGLRDELAKPEQEPVAWMDKEDCGDMTFTLIKPTYDNDLIPLYTAPPKPEPKSISTNDHLCAMLRQVHDVLACTALPMKRPWVGLTEEEMSDTYNRHYNDYVSDNIGIVDFIIIARAIEAKLKGKNT